MQAQRTYQVIAHHAIVFDVSEFIIQPGECCQIRQTGLPWVHAGHYRVVEKMAELYDRMLAGQRPCLMTVAVSRPLTRQQGDSLNQQRYRVSGIFSTAAGKATADVALAMAGGPAAAVAGIAATGAVAWLIQNKIPTFHAGDVLASLSATVKGGIGPQSSSLMLII
ncbi:MULTISPECIES: hypothetical protein [unclassified Pseudomonas]|uniref:hypothetical protein n=1 Tax=unclassified Pseudomonas TaxID=196821 RepID=UPI0019437A06|nr:MULTISPECIES: hypothetical protein [unclassified Pseudomonas]MDC0690243.1 hypothetical protein [Mitsuaria sp. RG]MCE0917595.1 hypothetical protein [Pseudomonas sp. NMI760_13]MCP8634742.1 hypothetical protein [Pseudomonas sp. DVZ6]MDD7786003.1 hypothetical protein [Pseudomonas sp. DVZ24]BCJ05764.1 hypothetical protein PRtIB026_A44400 [Pseudomonas sp. RtIB026]